jgi:tetratricopeptide (TPR) repeat protein
VANNKDKLVASAQKLVEKGQFEKAIKEYLKVVQEDDRDVRIWLKIGDLYAKLGKKPEATETYTKVAEFYSAQGFYLKAVAVYKQILKIDPRLVDVNQRLAELYKQLGLLKDAMEQYEAVATYFSREGRTRDALAALKQIVELDPETVANRIKLAELYSQQQMVREAIDEFTRAAEQLKEAGRVDEYLRVAERLLFMSPDNRPVSRELARLYIQRGDPRKALPKLQICFKADPRDPEVLSLLASAFEALEQRQKAVSVLKELARVQAEQGDRRGREDTFRRILALAPGDPDAEAALSGAIAPRNPPQPPPVAVGLTGAAPALGSTGSQPLVGSDFPQQQQQQQARQSQPQRPQTVALDDHDNGAEEFDERPGPSGGQATGAGGLVDTGGADVGETIARVLNETDVYIKYKLFAKAIEHIQRVFELDPRNVEAREKLKALYLTVGKREEAVLELWALAEQSDAQRRRRYLREILELEPDHARARQALGEEPSGAAPVPVDDAEVLDEDIEELPVEALESADSDRIDLPPMQPEGEDDLIPISVDERKAAAAVPEEEVDRFGLPDDEGGDLTPPPEVVDVPAFAPQADDDNDVRTRFDDSQPAIHSATGSGEVDEADLPPVPVRPATGTHRQPPPQGLGLTPQPTGDEDEVPAEALQTNRITPAQASAAQRAETSLEDDLDEADFFLQQNLLDEAQGILTTLNERFPGHPLVQAKLRDLESQRAAGAAVGEPPAAEPASEPIADLAAAPPDELPGDAEAAPPPAGYDVSRRGVIEKGVTAEDYETHYDLGIAYKEMGLIDDAVNEFKLVMKDPQREVQCHLMIGLCLLEKGQQTEAIAHFKKGLYVDGITEREALSLYFELGAAYERLGDSREALYYYEKVLKRDPRFRGVEKLVEALRSGGVVAEERPSTKNLADDLDNAFDALEGEG